MGEGEIRVSEKRVAAAKSYECAIGVARHTHTDSSFPVETFALNFSRQRVVVRFSSASRIFEVVGTD